MGLDIVDTVIDTPPALSFDSSDAALAQMERILRDMQLALQDRKEALRAMQRAQHDAMMALSRAARQRDDDTGSHVVRIGCLSEALALHMGQSVQWSRLLRLAAPMHDIGKIGTPDSVLKKAGPLTPQERLTMNQHAWQGAEILGAGEGPLFRMAAEVAMTHHENWNGTGYPHGQRGQQIPLAGRIVAVVDFFDALTMDRCYRPAFNDTVALDMLRGETGLRFDPVVVACFVKHADEMIALREYINERGLDYGDLLGELSLQSRQRVARAV